MRITELELTNFRCFSKFKTSFHPTMNVFIGENGSGKTSLVRAINVALRLFTSKPGSSYGFPSPLTKEDIKYKTIEYDGVVNEYQIYPSLIHSKILTNSSQITNKYQEQKTGNTLFEIEIKPSLFDYYTTWIDHVKGNLHNLINTNLPLFACFPSKRTKEYKLNLEKNLSPNLGDYSRDWVQDSWQKDYQPLQEMLQWIYRYTLVSIQRRKAVPQLEAISQAVCNCIEDAEEFYFDMATLDLAIRTKDNRFVPLPLLSGGYQSMLMMVAEIAWKAAILNPHLGAEAAKKTPGVVLIDEVDLHLHPRWQHRVLRDLRTTFPEMQFIVTTHSPQIISTAEAGWLRILDGGEEPRLVEHVQGWDSNAVLEQIMGAHHRPPETQEKLTALFAAIAEEDFPKAKALLEQLERQMGHAETELVHARLTMQDLPMDADHEKNPEVP